MHLLTLRLCRNISPIPDSLIAMLQWATSHSITGKESASSAPRRSLCFQVPLASRCSCPSIREDSRSGGTWATRDSWSGTPWPEPSNPNDHPSTPQPTSAGTTSSCPHTTASLAVAGVEEDEHKKRELVVSRFPFAKIRNYSIIISSISIPGSGSILICISGCGTIPVALLSLVSISLSVIPNNLSW